MAMDNVSIDSSWALYQQRTRWKLVRIFNNRIKIIKPESTYHKSRGSEQEDFLQF